ncbi:thiamine diphosphokinase [Francisellaceae bacterium CB299]|jgi:thiamine pyrophosphokinase
MTQQAILFLNGKVDLDFCENYISKNYANLPIVCADGSFNKIQQSKKLYSKLVKVIGDFDSTTCRDDERFEIDYDQNTTDFQKCLNYLIKKDCEKVLVFGASEGEMDHFIGNVSTALGYDKKISVEFIDKYSRYFFIPKKFTVEDVKGKMFSVMPFGVAENIHYNGLKYPLDGQNMALGAMLGTRNYAVEDIVEISYAKGNILLFISHNNYKDRVNK